MNHRANKDRRRCIPDRKITGATQKGRYGRLTTGTVPAFSILNGG